MKFKLFASVSIILAAALALGIPANAGQHRDSRPGPRKNTVWEPEIPISEDVVISGFRRPRIRNGYRWIDAVQDDSGYWQSGYWVPINAQKMTDQINYPGYWGPKNRAGYLWLNVEDRAGEYPSGSWEKMNSHQVVTPPLQWVRGYWDGRKWMDGYWRLPKKDGHIWFEGYYNSNGRWQEARWIPEPEQEPEQE